MSWTAYKIVLRLESPMHMGQAKMGNLQITRPYVHGKALWGALTARITRETTPARAEDYQTVGKQVNDELAFSYFYPATGEEVDLWPWDDPERFAWRFLGSYASTALDYSQNSALDGSLHETEFIAPYTRDGQPVNPVNLVGYIFEQTEGTLPWKDALHKLQIGGERTYGWGRVRLSDCSPAQSLFEYNLDLTGARPVVAVPEEGVLLAHARAHGERTIPAQGRVVPLVGRETKNAGQHGQDVVMAAVCWEPGSRAQAHVRVRIGENGIWEAGLP